MSDEVATTEDFDMWFDREEADVRQSLYAALSKDGNPSLDTIMKVTKALGIALHARPSAPTSQTTRICAHLPEVHTPAKR